jgi:catalase
MKQAVDKVADAAKSLAGNDPITLSTGAPIGDARNSLSAGPQGPLLLADPFYLEKVRAVAW